MGDGKTCDFCQANRGSRTPNPRLRSTTALGPHTFPPRGFRTALVLPLHCHHHCRSRPPDRLHKQGISDRARGNPRDKDKSKPGRHLGLSPHKMVLHTFETQNIGPIFAEDLTPDAFAPYGGVLLADEQIKTAQQLSANYGTAIKLHRVSAITNAFAHCPLGAPATANWNIFRCKAPMHLIGHELSALSYKSTVLERHPFSTQTFVPMGEQLDKKAYLVIVASLDPNLDQKLPDPKLVKAFVCRGNQGVTYGAGTWHAPMVVIDEKIDHIDFGVMIYENGVDGEDCQEVYFEPGYKIEYAKVE